MNKKNFAVILSIVLLSVILCSCSLFKPRKNNVSNTSSLSSSDEKTQEQSSSSSQLSSSSSAEESSSGEQSSDEQSDEEYVQEIEQWKDDLLGAVEDAGSVKDIANATPEMKKDLASQAGMAREYLDNNEDGKIQFVFFASKKGIASTVATTAIENLVGSYSYVEFLGDGYALQDILDSYGDIVEVVLVANSSDESLMNEFLKENSLQTSDRYIMVMDVSELASML